MADNENPDEAVSSRFTLFAKIHVLVYRTERIYLHDVFVHLHLF